MRLIRIALPALLALAACSGAPEAPEANVSQRIEVPLPEPRQEVASAATDELGVWVIGGFDAAGTSSPSVFRFDGRTWTRERDLPVGLDHPAAAVLGGVVYVAGGNTAGVASRRVFALPGPRELAPLGHARGGLALVAAGGKLYAMGGTAGGRNVGPAEEYDAVTDR